eukprot:TRINITY_DN10849_c0_g1_i1.p1 TRINITY_DN10849_c0_g1~~TRINITY_DN10849_c0_g1_i1.p1  ORF type:complete len:280 (+),score=40.23 TRINITY_DN10849_c0_g1_i1:25-864(+)
MDLDEITQWVLATAAAHSLLYAAVGVALGRWGDRFLGKWAIFRRAGSHEGTSPVEGTTTTTTTTTSKAALEPPLRRVVAVVALNHTILLLLQYYVYFPILLKGVLRTRSEFRPLAALLHFIVCLLCEDTLFYWGHRALHTRLLYKRIHKIHHEFRRTRAWAAEYAHPVEFVVADVVPTFTGPLLVHLLRFHASKGSAMHLWTLQAWLTYRFLEALDGHCGYALPFSPFAIWPLRPSAKMHDYHHSHNVGNFGSQTMFWDKLMGTFRGTVDQPVPRRRSN